MAKKTQSKKKPKNSRRIGKDAELEGAGRLNRLFGTNFRRSSQNRGAPDAPDIIDDDLPEFAIESKRRAFSVELDRAIQRARDERGDGCSSFVIHRGSGERWKFSADLFELPVLVLRLARLLHVPVTCSNCSGQGVVVFTNRDPLESKARTAGDCPECSGTGFDPDDVVSAFFENAIAVAEVHQGKVEAEGVDGRRIEKRERAAKKKGET